MLRCRYLLVLMRLFLHSTNFQSDQAKHADLFTKCQAADESLMGIPNFSYSGKPELITFGCQYECWGLVFDRVYINVCVYYSGNIR